MTDTSTNSNVVNDSELLRIIAFILLVTLVNLWSVRHFGWGTTNPGILALILAGPGVAIKLLDWMGILDRDRKAWISGRIRPTFMVILSTQWLVMGYSALLVLSLMVVSISIVPGPGDNGKTIHVTSVTKPVSAINKKIASSSSAVLVHVFISPFGSTYSVKIDGYLEKLVTVYPFVGRTLFADSQLVKIPTVYVRPSKYALESLRRKSKLVIRLSQASEPDLPPQRVMLDGRRSAYLIGEERQIPSHLPAVWREELIASNVTNSSGIARIMQAWRNFTKVTPGLMAEPQSLDIRSGTTIQVDVVTPAGNCIAGSRTKIRKRQFVDLPLDNYDKPKKCLTE